MASITFSSCFYLLRKSKFDATTYITWMNNFLSVVRHCNVVIYTDTASSAYIDTKGNHPHIRIVIKPMEQFVMYQYKSCWMKNHDKNILLNRRIDWEINMLWSEKIWFVKETMDQQYFDTEFYGWCDIGYFRNRDQDLHTDQLVANHWPNIDKLNTLQKEQILYACVNNNKYYMRQLYHLVNDKTAEGLPKQPIPATQQSIAGGFFLLHKDKDKITWWANTYTRKLELYFTHDYLVKDDQIILVDCILSDPSNFALCQEQNALLDNWFMFQRILL